MLGAQLWRLFSRPDLAVGVVRLVTLVGLAVIAFLLSVSASGPLQRSYEMGFVLAGAVLVFSALLSWHLLHPHERFVRWCEPPLDCGLLVIAMATSAFNQQEVHVLTKSPGQLLLLAVVALAALRQSWRFTAYAATVAVAAYASLFWLTLIAQPQLIRGFAESGDLAAEKVGISRVWEVGLFLGVVGMLIALASWHAGVMRDRLRGPVLIDDFDLRRALGDSQLRAELTPLIAAGAFDDAQSHALALLDNRMRRNLPSDQRTLSRRAVAEGLFLGAAPRVFVSPDVGTQRAAVELYSGVLGVLRNPLAHGWWPNDPQRASRTILFVDMLLGWLGPPAPPPPTSPRRDLPK